MKSSPTSKWIVDAAMLAGYCVAVWLDLTGLELHQWIGVGVGLLAGYHLLTHMDWVTAVTRRLFGKTSPRARIYYLIDALMLGGFVTIGVTGLLISSWLNLTLGGMAALAALHKWTAYLTLAAVFVKLALHWRWIVSVAGKVFAAPAAPRANAGLPARSYTRRETLQLMGATALSTVAVVSVASKALAALQVAASGSAGASAAQATDTPPSAVSAPVSAPVSVAPATATTVAAAPTTTTVAAAPTATTVAPSTATTVAAAPTTTTVAAAPTATTMVATASLACISCRRGKHCSYPGDCRDYVDTNGNNRCDRGECA